MEYYVYKIGRKGVYAPVHRTEVAGSNPGHDIDLIFIYLFIFLLEKFLSFFVVP